MRFGQGGSDSCRLSNAQKLIETTAMAMQMRIFALVIVLYLLNPAKKKQDQEKIGGIGEGGVDNKSLYRKGTSFG